MTKSRRGRPESETQGLRLLRKWLDDPQNGKTQTSLAADLGLSQAAISQWLSGKNRPDAHFRVLLERVCAIPADAWFTPDERRSVYGRHGRNGTDG